MVGLIFSANKILVEIESPGGIRGAAAKTQSEIESKTRIVKIKLDDSATVALLLKKTTDVKINSYNRYSLTSITVMLIAVQ